jgi:glycosyltransferase involved in cell wall biosynthesis
VKFAFLSTCPPGVYSGGRYHALIAASCLARRGHDVTFIANNEPAFLPDLAPLSPDNPVRIRLTKTFALLDHERFDAVVVAPQLTPLPGLYAAARSLARDSDAALAFFSYETPNWFNRYAPSPRPEEGWSDWVRMAREGALILCSAEESRRHAEAFYRDLSPESMFAVWQPAINSVAIEASPWPDRERRIVIFARPTDSHKGSDEAEALLRPDLAGCVLSVVIGNPRGAEGYIERLRARGQEAGVGVEFHERLSDIEKFALIKRSSLLVFPSHFEGYGYPPIEALASGTACLAYDLPVLRETCGDAVRFVPMGDQQALGEAAAAMMRDPPAVDRDRPGLRALAEVDIRAEALERVLTDYIDERRRRLRLPQRVLDAPTATATAVSLVRTPAAQVAHLTLETARPIYAAAAADPAVLSCTVRLRSWGRSGALHDVLLLLSPKAEAQAVFGPLRLSLSFLGGEGFDIEIAAPLRRSLDPTPPPEAAFGLTRRSVSGAVRSLFAWAAPEMTADAAILVHQGPSGLGVALGILGLRNDDPFKRRPGGGTDETGCGIEWTFAADEPPEQATAILIRGATVVLAASLGAGALAKARAEDALVLGNPKGGFGRAQGLQGRGSDTRSCIEAWMADIARPRKLLVWRRGPDGRERLLAASHPNKLRPDVASRIGAASALLGFALHLPPRLPGEQDSLALGRSETRHGPRTPAPDLAPDEGAVRTGVAKTRTLRAAPTKAAIGKTQYDLKAQRLSVEGWSLAEGPVQHTLLRRSDGTVLATTHQRVERADVTRKWRPGSRERFGFVLSAQLPVDGLDGLRLLLTLADGTEIDVALSRIVLVQPKEFAVLDSDYDEAARLLWMRGFFYHKGLRLAELEVRQDGRTVAAGATGIKQLRHDEPLAGWRVEALLDEPLRPRAPLEIVGRTPEGFELRLQHSVPLRQRPQDPVLPASALAEEDPLAVARRLWGRRAPGERIALLVVHNLDAVDRPEKPRSLAQLRKELAARGVRLVVLHHAQNPAPGGLEEVSFFDPALAVLSRMEVHSADRPLDDLLPPAFREAAARKLYGFAANVNRTPRPWEDCRDQVEDEARRLSLVLRAVQPEIVLLWHQWNSLCEIARALADRLGIPSGFLHEGMLPRTLTFDTAGMMAESAAVGATLAPGDRDARLWLDRARRVLGRIAADRMDRKPLSRLSVAEGLRARADRDGRPVVFYAGINDWHSGNLPRDAGALVHSPVFRDTLDGLDAVAAAGEAEGWTVAFKPHPNLFPRGDLVDPRVVLLRESNAIDCLLAADVVVTILSSIAYIALAHGKPTVLLGRNTLTGTGAAHEVHARDEVAPRIRDALAGRDAARRRHAFRRHVAALLRDHLYAYDAGDTLAFRGHDLLAEAIAAQTAELPDDPARRDGA